MTTLRTCAVALVLMSGLAAHADDQFTLTATVGASATGTRALNTVEQVFDALTDAQLRALVPSYTGVEGTTLEIDYRGLAIDAEYPSLTPYLTLNIPALGIREQFLGRTREESRQQLREYLKRGDTLDRIMQLLAQSSPTDPLAGNPASLQTRMVAGRYRNDFATLAREQTAAAHGGADSVALSAGASVGHVERQGLRSLTLGLPMSVALGSDAARPWSMDGELQYTRTEGAAGYGLQLGTSYRWRQSERWFLVPGATLGLTGSRDMGSVGTIVSASLTSALRLLDTADMTVWMGNGLNWMRTLKTSLAGYSSNPHLKNLALSNGVQASFLSGSVLSNHWLELSFTDSRYFGSDLYDERYDELGIALVQAHPGARLASARYEFSILNSPHSRGYAARVHFGF